MNRDQVPGRSFAALVASVLLYVVARNFVKSRKKSTRRKADDIGASSSSAASAGSGSYDVFLNFRGEDTRKTFANYLYNSLVDAGIRVFIDDNELSEGEEISTNLLQAIKNSKISIPILSVNYASSKWCLQELVEMTECMKSVGHVVLPIFYRVEPAHVRYQKGIFGEKFSHLSEKYLEEDVAKWKHALQEVASLKGWESEKTANGREGDLVKMVVQKVLSKFKKAFQLVVPEQLVGIDNAVEDILSLLDDNLEATQIVGIYGMGGIGKTTLAKVVHNTLSNQFQYHSFIADIRETLQRHGIPYLQEQLIHGLRKKDRVYNKDEGIGILKSEFKHKKILVLLDDVDDDVQIKDLVGNFDWFGMGSKIIITTRIKRVLDKVEVNNTYELKGLAKDESLILFSRHAFFMDSPPCEFDSLSRAVVSTTGGLPLALEVIGSFLCRQNQKFWQDALKKLQKVPHEKVREKLMISYKALSYEAQQIFLDIACFFIGEDLRYASYMWDACNYHPWMGIETLSFMSLIKIGDHGEVQMHDQLRDLGREIVQQEDYEVLMNQSRLCIHKEEDMEVLGRNEGIRVKACCLDEDWKDKHNVILWRDLKREFTTEQFETLRNLRFLTVFDAKLIGDSRNLLRELRWLVWRGCPAFAATNFSLEKLVILDLSKSDISELWEGWSHLKMAKQLKVLDLNYCDRLEVTPDLSAFQKLKIIRLKSCDNLKQIHRSIGAAKDLVSLDLQYCCRLRELPQEMGELEELKELDISGTDIVEIPPCIGYLKKLEVLSAYNCKSLVGLPDSISHLVNLLTLDLTRCLGLCELPESIGSLMKLQRLSCGYEYLDPYLSALKSQTSCELNSSYEGICKLPESIGDLKNLKSLRIFNSKKLRNLPSTISKLGNLEELNALNCGNLRGEIHIDGLSKLKILQLSGTGISSFHGTFDKLSHLEELKLGNCHMLQSLSELPASLTVLDVTGQHRTFPPLSHLIHLKELKVMDCPLLESMPELPCGLLRLYVRNCGELKELPSLLNLKFLSRLSLFTCGQLTEIKGLEGLKSLASLIVLKCGKSSVRSNGPILNDDQVQGLENLKNLETISLYDCESLVRLDVSQLTRLRAIALRGCSNLVEIKGLERLKSLKSLDLVGCPSVKILPDLSCFPHRQNVIVDEHWNLADVPGVGKARYLGEGEIIRVEYLPHRSNFED
ncbi:hypothetical protein BT93_L0320 [Corymbia citriodora subsp. variegata]|uniref:TIR domain-containing protein n=1 Tax=Corymbia citriodora subsp. variegata TaxID=360336 RepID=A0A8T0CQ43_CORYI|nr:hypothetical protein BT93_L0320 [Corymbia citriodora subsp. variegata]